MKQWVRCCNACRSAFWNFGVTFGLRFEISDGKLWGMWGKTLLFGKALEISGCIPGQTSEKFWTIRFKLLFFKSFSRRATISGRRYWVRPDARLSSNWELCSSVQIVSWSLHWCLLGFCVLLSLAIWGDAWSRPISADMCYQQGSRIGAR